MEKIEKINRSKKEEKEEEVVDSKYDIHRNTANSWILITKVLCRFVPQMNWPEEVDQVHGVDQQSMLWMDTERPKPIEICIIHRIARIEGNQNGKTCVRIRYSYVG